MHLPRFQGSLSLERSEWRRVSRKIVWSPRFTGGASGMVQVHDVLIERQRPRQNREQGLGCGPPGRRVAPRTTQKRLLRLLPAANVRDDSILAAFLFCQRCSHVRHPAAGLGSVVRQGAAPSAAGCWRPLRQRRPPVRSEQAVEWHSLFLAISERRAEPGSDRALQGSAAGIC